MYREKITRKLIRPALQRFQTQAGDLMLSGPIPFDNLPAARCSFLITEEEYKHLGNDWTVIERLQKRA